MNEHVHLSLAVKKVVSLHAEYLTVCLFGVGGPAGLVLPLQTSHKLHELSLSDRCKSVGGQSQLNCVDKDGSKNNCCLSALERRTSPAARGRGLTVM